MTPSMLFFTPALYRAIQHDAEAAIPRWQQALDMYRVAIANHATALLPRLVEIAALGELHDARIDAIELDDETLTVLLHVSGPTSRGDADEAIRLRYGHVLSVVVQHVGTVDVPSSRPMGLRDAVGSDWLYDEVRVAEGAFEHHAMIAQSHDELALLGVRFRGFDFERVPVG